jgi:hypothetical protein
MANETKTGITYKRTSQCRKLLVKPLNGWSADEVRTYGKAISENTVDTDVTCWHEDRVVRIYRNGKIV